MSASGSGVSVGSQTIPTRGAAVTLSFEYYKSGSLHNPSSVTVEDPTGEWGSRRVSDTSDVVCEAGRALTRKSTGVYHLTVPASAAGAEYEYYVKVVDSGVTTHSRYVAVSFVTGGFSNIYTLAGVRRRVVTDSGRFDLVNDADNGDFGDAGANEIINAAQRWLEDHIPKIRENTWLITKQSSQIFTFSSARYFKEAWVTTSDGRRVPLERKDWQQLRNSNLYVEPESGCVNFWATIPVGVNPWQWTSNFDLYTDLDWLYRGDYYPQQGVMVFPKPASETQFEFLCEWRATDLTNDADVSYWTVTYPELLVRAARMQIEMDLHRNGAGAREFEAAIISQLGAIYNRCVADTIGQLPYHMAQQEG